MARLTLEIDDGQKRFTPGEAVHGIAGWELDKPAGWVELRLLWYTQGKGDRDAAVVATQRWDNPASPDAQIFNLTLPDGPYSFSGSLVSILWALELVADRCKPVARVEITMSPTGAEMTAR